MIRLPAIVRPRNDLTAVGHHNGANRQVAGFKRHLCFGERDLHISLVRCWNPHRSPLFPGYANGMQLHIANHPLIDHKMTLLRDRNTKSPTFRELVAELVNLLSYEATRTLRVDEVTVHTPVAPFDGVHVSRPLPLVVPIIRAGLGMLDGFLKLMPHSEVGFIGIQRNEETLQPETYAKRLPDNLADRQCFVLDPMLATGGSLAATVDYLLESGAREVTAICLVAAPEGIQLMRERFPNDNVQVIVAAEDEGLNEQGFIVPGLGDAGDRLYGIAE